MVLFIEKQWTPKLGYCLLKIMTSIVYCKKKKNEALAGTKYTDVSSSAFI